MKRKLYIIPFFLLTVLFAFAQSNQIISGVVVEDRDNGEPLPGVNVYLKDRPGVGVATDMNGHFSIKAAINDILIFSYLGYNNYEHRVNKPDDKLTIRMTESSTMLEEAVVIGMGTQRKISVVGAITSVKAEDLQMPATNINNVLGGRVPGIISVMSSGEPGKNISEFWVRGIGTFGANSSALVLIDGLEGRSC